VYWEVRARTREHLARARPGGQFILRLFVAVPTWEGPRLSTRDVAVEGTGDAGDQIVTDLPAGAVVRVALGWARGAEFVPVAHSPALEVRGESLVRWTLKGGVPVHEGDVDARAIAAAVARVQTTSSG
jgi:hypothetical protein